MRSSNKKVLVTTVTLSSLILAGCSGNLAADSLPSRLTLKNQLLTVGSGNSSSAIGVVTAPTLQLVASLAPPVVNGVTLQANDVIANGTSAYVAYNVAGTGTGGGVDVVNVAVPTIPALGSSTTYPDTDINGLFYSTSALYAAGQNLSNPSILNTYSLSLLGSVTGLVSTTPQTSYAGVKVSGDTLGTYLYTVSGDTGGFTAYNRSSMTQLNYTALHDARDVGVSLTNGKAYVVTGQPGALYAFTPTGAVDTSVNSTGSLALGGATIPQSKSTIQVGIHYAVATTGDGGTSIVCLDNMSVVATQAPPTPTSGVGVTNSAILAQGILMTANGDQGLNMYSVSTGSLISTTNCNNLTITFLGKVNFPTNVSVNSVKYLAGLVFVGGGLGGYQIVTATSFPVSTGLLTTL